MVLKYISNILANEFLFNIYFTITKSLRETFYKQESFGLTHNFGSFSPWFHDFTAYGGETQSIQLVGAYLD